MSFSITTKQVFTIAAIAAAAVLSAGTAFAQEATPDTWLQSVTSTKSRADVSTELAAARQSGLTKAWSAGYIEPVRSHLVRAQVKADTVRAIASGEVKAINAEVYSFAQRAPTRLSQAGQ